MDSVIPILLIFLLKNRNDNVLLLNSYSRVVSCFLGSNRRRRNRRMILAAMMGTYNTHFRPPNYSEYWIDQYLDADFFSLFRMTRKSFRILLQLMVTQGNFKIVWLHGKKPVSPEKMLQIGLKYLASKDGVLQLSDRFNVAISTVFIIRKRVLKSLLKLLPTLIKWPTGADVNIVKTDFETTCGFPNVIGAIDGSHIPLKVPTEISDSFKNRKMGHSIVLQGVCTRKKLFTDIFVGASGRTHDARVFRISDLAKNIEHYGYQKFFNEDLHLLGDSAYPLKQWMLVPYKDVGHLTREKLHFNTLHSKTRVAIENAFGLLKNRWQKCQFINVQKIQTAVEIVAACCVLHNFCLLQDDFFDTENPDEIDQNVNVVYHEEEDQIAIQKRNRIANVLFLSNAH